MEAPIDVEEESIGSLLEASRTPEGRSRLGPTVPSLLHRLPSSPPHLLLPRLRLLRNLCAGDAAIQDAFFDCDGPAVVSAVLLSTASPEIARAALQALGNAALAGERQRAAVWARFFPEGFLELSRIRDRGVCDPLCMVLDTCCSAEGGTGRLGELCGDGDGLRVLFEIITTASTAGYEEEWLEWLLFKACVEQPYFSQIFSKLCLSSGSDGDGLFGMQQAFVLGVLSNCLNERPKEVFISNNFALNVLKLLKEASNIVDFTSRGSSDLPTNCPSIDVLGYSLTIVRDICAWEGPLGIKAPVDSLISEGILELLLGFLKDLGLSSTVRKSIEHGRTKEALPLVAEPSKVCPYKGFRRDVVAIIGNCMHRRKHVQDEIRLCNGIPVLLQQCVLDEDNPFLREWGLMALRNLLEGNEENQHEVAALKLQGAVDTPEIASLGLRVELDEKSGCARLVNIS